MEKQTQEENKSLPIDVINKILKKNLYDDLDEFLQECKTSKAMKIIIEAMEEYRNLPNDGWIPLTKEEIEFMRECNMSRTYYDGKLCAVTILTDNDEGSFLEPNDLLKLSDILNRYVKTATI